jgi:hypothetical protein
MITAIKIPAELSAGDKSSPARHIPAVAICCDARQTAFNEVYAEQKSEYSARKAAAQAFRSAMPPLSGYQSICDFIACVAYGMAIQAIEDALGSKLLYAAQIALGSIRVQPKPPQTLPASTTPTPPPLFP